jgi:hypothetical protein
MITTLVYILVVLLIFGCITYVIGLLTIPPPFKNIAYIILLVVFVLILLSFIGVIPPYRSLQ